MGKRSPWGSDIPLPKGQPGSAAAAKALESTALSPKSTNVSKTQSPFHGEQRGSWREETQPLCKMQCAELGTTG